MSENNILIKQLIDVNGTLVYPTSHTDAIYYNETTTNESGEVEIEQKLLTEVIDELKEKSIDSLEASKVSYTYNNNSNVEQALNNLYDMINWKALTITISKNPNTTTYEFGDEPNISVIVKVNKMLSNNQEGNKYKLEGGLVNKTPSVSDDQLTYTFSDLNPTINTTYKFTGYSKNKDGSDEENTASTSVSFKYKVFYKVLNWTNDDLDISDFSLSHTDSNYQFYNNTLTFRNIYVTYSNRFCLCVPSNYKITSAKNISSSNAPVDYVQYKNNENTYGYTYDHNGATYNIWYINNADGLISPDGVVFTFESNK